MPALSVRVGAGRRGDADRRCCAIAASPTSGFGRACMPTSIRSPARRCCSRSGTRRRRSGCSDGQRRDAQSWAADGSRRLTRPMPLTCSVTSRIADVLDEPRARDAGAQRSLGVDDDVADTAHRDGGIASARRRSALYDPAPEIDTCSSSTRPAKSAFSAPEPSTRSVVAVQVVDRERGAAGCCRSRSVVRLEPRHRDASPLPVSAQLVEVANVDRDRGRVRLPGGRKAGPTSDAGRATVRQGGRPMTFASTTFARPRLRLRSPRRRPASATTPRDAADFELVKRRERVAFRRDGRPEPAVPPPRVSVNQASAAETAIGAEDEPGKRRAGHLSLRRDELEVGCAAGAPPDSESVDNVRYYGIPVYSILCRLRSPARTGERNLHGRQGGIVERIRAADPRDRRQGRPRRPRPRRQDRRAHAARRRHGRHLHRAASHARGSGRRGDPGRRRRHRRQHPVGRAHDGVSAHRRRC